MSTIDIKDVPNMSDKEIENLSFADRISLMKQRNDIKKFANKETKAQDIREQIESHAIPMVEKLQSIIYNNEQLSAQQIQAYDRLWPVISNLVSQTSDLKKIEAQNASEVLNLVSKGKLTLKDAAIMMSLLQSKVEIEELPKLIAQLEDANG